MALLGGASGAGFFFMENIARVISGYWSRIGPDRSSWVASPGFNPFYLFPDAYHGDSSIWLGHPEATMFVGLFLGFGLLIRKKTKLWPIVPAIGFLWVVWLHYMINGFNSGNRAFWVQIINLLHLNGGLTIFVLAFGLILSLGISMYTKYLYLQTDKEAQVSVQLKAFPDFLKTSSGQPMLIVKKLWSLRHFWSFRHAVAYGVFYAKQQKPGEVKPDWIKWLVSLRNQALGKPD